MFVKFEQGRVGAFEHPEKKEINGKKD